MTREPRSLTGKVVAITGGGRGIGRAIAQALTGHGARVAVGDLDRKTAAAAPAELGLEVDVTDHRAFTGFLDEVEQRLGPLDVLVNNAGIMAVTPLTEEDPASVQRQIELNLRAVIHGTQEAMRRMTPRGTGHIVNVASAAGRLGLPHLATYSATKHGVVGLSEAVRLELRGTGVDISVVMPGIARTELSTGLGDARVKTLTVEQVADEVIAALQVPRFDVYVPRHAGRLIQLGSALPRRLREAMMRVAKADQALLGADRAARAGYEARAARSAPAAEQERV